MSEALDHRGRIRVAVTGLGVKTGAGTKLDAFWSTLAAGRSTAAGIARYDPSDLPVRFGCEVRDFDPTEYLGAKEARRIDRVTQLGFAASADALADTGDHRCDPARSAVIVGTGVGGLITLEEQIGVYNEKGAARVSPFLVPMMMANATAGTIAMQFGWKGPNFCVATACAASANAIGEAARLIRDDSADIVMTGGSESCMTPTAISAFARMTALSTRNDDPVHASRPFDAAPPPVTSTKGVTGHLIGAAGATEAIACLLALAHGAAPPTANLERIGDDIALDVIAGEARELAPAPALSNSFGFGGHNATLVLAPAS